MPRYVVQLTFPEGLHIPIENGGAELCRGVIERPPLPTSFRSMRSRG